MDEKDKQHQEIASKKSTEGLISGIPTGILFLALCLFGFSPTTAGIICVVAGFLFYLIVSHIPSFFAKKWLYLPIVCIVPGALFGMGKILYQVHDAKSTERSDIVRNDAVNYDTERNGVRRPKAQQFVVPNSPKLENPLVKVDSNVTEYGFSSPRSSEPLVLKVEPFQEGAHIEDIEVSLTKEADPDGGMFLVQDKCIDVSGQTVTITPSRDWGVYSLFLTGKCKTSQNTFKLVKSIATHVAYDKERLEELTQSKAGPRVGKVNYDNGLLALDGAAASSQISFLHGLMMLRPYSIYVEATILGTGKDPDGVIDFIQPNGVVVSLRDKVALGGKRGNFDLERRTFLLSLRSLRQRILKFRVSFDGIAYCVEDLNSRVRINLGQVSGQDWSDVATVAVRGCVCKISAIAIGTYTVLKEPKHQYSIEDKS